MFRTLILLSAAALAGAAGHFSDGMKSFEKGRYDMARRIIGEMAKNLKNGGGDE